VHRLVAVILLASVAQASADGVAADRAAAEAQTRASNGDFVGAATKYREAFTAEPRPDLMCNVGVAYYKAKDLPRAQRYLEQCLAIGTSLDRAFITNVKKVLAAVESTLESGSFTPVDLLVQPPTATTAVEGGAVFDEPIVGSRRVWFPFGSYRLTVHADGYTDRVIEVGAKDRKPVRASVALQRAAVVETPPPPPAETGPKPPPADVGSGSAVVEQPPPLAPTLAKRSIVPPVAATVVTVGLGGFALGFFLAARTKAEEAGNATTMALHEELANDARSYQYISWGVAAGAGVGAIVSGLLWVRYANPPRVEVQASGGGAAVTLTGRW
jgi:hypothetical protein